MEPTIKDLIPYKPHIEDYLLKLANVSTEIQTTANAIEQLKTEAIALVNTTPTVLPKWFSKAHSYYPELYFHQTCITVKSWSTCDKHEFTVSEKNTYYNLLEPLSDEYAVLRGKLNTLESKAELKTKLEKYLAYISCKILHSDSIDISFLRELCVLMHIPKEKV